jgi:NADH:ubiquinone oxidoreductase subunit 4 (subunit M)
MLLLFILLFPLVLGAGLLLVKPGKPFAIALAGSIIEAIAIAYALSTGDASANQYSQAWLPEFGISFTLWIDGINGILIGLTGLLIPFM